MNILKFNDIYFFILFFNIQNLNIYKYLLLPMSKNIKY